MYIRSEHHVCDRILMSTFVAQHWMSCISLNSAGPANFKKKEEQSNRSRQNAKNKITLCKSGSKVKLGGARELARLLTTRHKFACFDVTSPVVMDWARSSLCLGRYCGRKRSATHRILKSHRYFNINILNTLIRITFILRHLWNNLTGFYVIWFLKRPVILIW